MENENEREESLKLNYNFSKQDFEQINKNNINLQKVEHELKLYKSSIKSVDLLRPAIINDGITVLDEDKIVFYVSVFELEKNNYSLEKFTPASGAASRMFQFLSEFLMDFDVKDESIMEYCSRKNNLLLTNFINGIEKFPFYNEVYNRLKQKYSDYDSWTTNLKNYEFINILLDVTEFDFANKPKAILPFHQYTNSIVTPIEEHIKEAKSYSNSNDKSRVHFTISDIHKSEFEKIVQNLKDDSLQITYSYQEKSTDTIAVDSNNFPLRNQKNELVFRPGGHGALIENLDKIDADIVFIKNIDNVIHSNTEVVSTYKKVLAGYLITLQKEIFNFLEILSSSSVINENLKQIENFISTKINIPITPDYLNGTPESKKSHLLSILNKPIRVCGMVKNENEPGGGPFWIREENGKESLQIIESSQIDIQNNEQVTIFKSATHFNPVDLVCGLKNYQGEKFNLNDFVYANSGFIVQKSKDGVPYKAYELPGLWNGAMANWITIFIEVPLITFNPVKTVNDLLKANHQKQ